MKNSSKKVSNVTNAKKTVVLARELRPGEAPKRIKTAWDTLVAHVGFMICYDVSDGKKRASLDSYNHWPVDPASSSKPIANGMAALPGHPTTPKNICSIWAANPITNMQVSGQKSWSKPQWIQSPESIEPILIPPDGWITIGIEGEPTSMTETEFRQRYHRIATSTSKK